MTDTAPSRRERKKLEARERIYSAALALFEERGFEGTRIEDITEGADVAVGTFFTHFPSKEAVLTGYHRLYVERQVKHMSGLDQSDVRERFRAVMKWTARTSRKESKIFKIMMRRLILQSDLLKDNVPVILESFRIMESWIVEAQESGAMTRQFKPELIRAAISDIWNMALLKWSGSDKLPHPENDMLTKLDLLWSGMGGEE